MKNWYFTFEVWKYQSLCLKSSRRISTEGIYPVVEQLEGNAGNREPWTHHLVILVTRPWRSDTWEVGPEPSCQIPCLAICWEGARAGSRDQGWYHFWPIAEELLRGMEESWRTVTHPFTTDGKHTLLISKNREVKLCEMEVLNIGECFEACPPLETAGATRRSSDRKHWQSYGYWMSAAQGGIPARCFRCLFIYKEGRLSPCHIYVCLWKMSWCALSAVEHCSSLFFNHLENFDLYFIR